MALKISSKGLSLIKQFEGCQLTAYQDSVGVWTIGWGTTNSDKSITGLTIKKGVKITQAQADSFLEKSINNKYAPKVNKYYSKYKFNQNQFDALVSFAYNVGSIDQLTNNGKRTIKEISTKFLAYNKAGGKVLAGLTRRRTAEKKLFDTAVVTVTYYKKYTGTSQKIDEVFKAISAPYGSVDKRKPVAKKNGISTYSGTAEQNTKLISLAKNGKLKK